ncbi:MAG TPA: glycosyl hydrolase family 18 protein [Rugosimonospora sp.]|nr:glycosyl hydrolase family 18 protein [Rugosimonospora sp.]
MIRSRRLALLCAGAATAVTAVAAVALAVPDASAASNTIANPGFETGSLASWSCSSVDSVVPSPVHSGGFALAGAASNSDDAQCGQTVTVAADTSYTLSAYVNGAYVFIGVSGAVSASNWTPSTGGGYSLLSVTFTSGSATSVTVYVHGWYAQGTYYADDFEMDGPGGGTPSPTPSNSPSPSPSPSASPTPSPSPTTNPGSSLPRHELTGYWQNFDNGAKALRLRDVPTSYDLIAVAFGNADAANPGGVTFAVDPGLSAALGGYTDADLRADVATVHGRGQHVVLSVGGQNGAVSVADAASAANFATSVYGIMTSFGFDGVDIDLENGVNATYMAQALRSLSGKAGAGLIITMAPQTIDMQSTGTQYFQLALSIKDILTVVHTQYYNSGSMLGCDQSFAYSQGTENFLTALACIQLQSALRPDQVALGLPASGSAAGGGYVDPSVVDNALDCLARGSSCGSFVPPATWPGIRGAMTWSINWDAANGYAFANTVKPHLGTLP